MDSKNTKVAKLLDKLMSETEATKIKWKISTKNQFTYDVPSKEKIIVMTKIVSIRQQSSLEQIMFPLRSPQTINNYELSLRKTLNGVPSGEPVFIIDTEYFSENIQAKLKELWGIVSEANRVSYKEVDNLMQTLDSIQNKKVESIEKSQKEKKNTGLTL